MATWLESDGYSFDLQLEGLGMQADYPQNDGSSGRAAGDDEGESEEVSDGKQSRRKAKCSKRVSKNIISERKRRQKLNEKLYSLRAIVPKITKMDKASIMADAATYIQELKQQVNQMRRQVEDSEPKEPLGAAEQQSPPVSEVIDTPEWSPPSPVKKRLQVDVEKLADPETCMLRFICCAAFNPLLAGVLESLNVQIVSGTFASFGGQLYSSYITKVRDKELMNKDTLESVICNAMDRAG